MDNQILFIILGIIIWVFQMVIKSRTKAKREAQNVLVKNQKPQEDREARFYNVLKDFSNNLKREIEQKPSTPKYVVNDTMQDESIEPLNEEEEIEVTATDFKPRRHRKKTSIAPNLKSPKTLKEAVIASEILKTKF